MEQTLRQHFAKYLKGIRKYLTDIKVRLNMDEIVKILEAPIFKVDDLNAIFLKDQNIKAPLTQYKTPSKPEPNSFHQKQMTQMGLPIKHHHTNTNNLTIRDRFKTEQSLEYQAISFDFKKIKESLSFGMLQFNRNTKTLASINFLTKDIDKSLNSSQTINQVVDNKINSRSIIKQKFLQMEKEIYRRLCEKDNQQVSGKNLFVIPDKINLDFYSREQTERKVIIETKPFLVFN